MGGSGGGGGSWSRFTENEMAISNFTDNNMGISRFAAKETFLQK